jgi:hypothetical protein
MKKQVLFMVVLLVAVGLLAGVAASTAFANSGYMIQCGPCHGTAGPAPVVTLTSNNGTTATYSVSSPTAFEWAVFQGTTWLDGTFVGGHGSPTNTAKGGSFTVPVGATYTVYAVFGEQGNPAHGAQTSVTPEGGTNFTITPSAGANGSISPATAQTVDRGNNATFTITPSTGYHVADVLVDGASVGAVTTYTFTNVTANHTIAASFAQDLPTSYTITTTAGENGAITPVGPQTVAPGANITFTIAPSAGYYVDSLKIDGVAVQQAKTYTFTNVQANHSIEASFAASPAMSAITTTVVGGNGGSVIPGINPFTLPLTSSVVYYFVPDAGFHIDTVTVNGWAVTLDDDDSYTFAAVDRNYAVSVKFAPNTYKVTASVGGTGKGAISPSGETTVAEGASASYTITPDAGNSISDVVVDGVSVGITSSYTFSDVKANHTIQAKFVTASVNYTITPSVTGGFGGSITPFPLYVVPSGASVTFYFLPNDGYMVGTVTVDGTPVDASLIEDDYYIFENITANHTLGVAFVPIPPVTHVITPTAGDHGAISPATEQTVTEGDDAAFTITPDAGYHVADVVVDNVSMGALTSYTFEDVTADHTISATFEWTKLPTSTALKASARTLKRGKTVTLTGTLKGGTFTDSSLVFQVKKPGQKAYKTFKTCKVSATGVAKCKYKVTVKGNWYFRVKFLGDDTYLPAPVKPATKLVVK